MLVRYVSGLAVAFVTVVAAFVLTVAMATPSARLDLAGLIGVALPFGLIAAGVLGLVIGPAVLTARGLLGPRLGPAGAAAIGALLSPVCLFAIWLVFREHDETVAGTLRFWARVPMEFVLGVLPHAAGSAVFAAWIARSPRRRTIEGRRYH